MNLISNFVLLFLFIITAESFPIQYNCSDNTNTKISENINTLLPTLVSGAIQDGFIATSYGKSKARIFGLAQCRGDVERDDCSTCLQDAAHYIHSLCANLAGARTWYDYCFLRYDNKKFFNKVDTSGGYYHDGKNVTDPDSFNKKLAALMDQISSQAVKLSSKGLGKGQTDISEFVRLYALVQCTRDLSAINCAQCLAIAIANFPKLCFNRRGCRILYSSCYVRYELYPF